jgi:hypothetical protein
MSHPVITREYGENEKEGEPDDEEEMNNTPQEEELSKCCKAKASWNFSFKSCDKCGKRFEPEVDTPREEEWKKEFDEIMPKDWSDKGVSRLVERA